MAERAARRRKSSKSVEELQAEISARDKEKAERAAARKPSGAAAEAQEAARKRRNAEKYEQEKAARAKKGSSGYGYSQHLMGGSSRSSSFNPRSVREEVLVDYLLDEGFASDEKSAQAIANVMSEEWVLDVLDEVTGGGHISPHGTSYTGKTSASQKKYNKFRDQYSGGDTQTTRDRVGIRSKYSRDSREELPSRNSGGTARSPEGTPSGLAMSPDRRMETRAKSLRAKGQGKRANKIDAVRNRPNMSESWIEGIVEDGFNSSGRYDVGGGRTVGPVAGAVRSLFGGNLPKGQTYVPPSPQKGTNRPSAVPSSKGDSGKLTDFGAGGGKAKLKTGMSVGQVERQGRMNRGDYSG